MPAAPLGVPPAQSGLPYFTDSRMNNELPTVPNQPWPPTRFNPVQFDYRVWDAWWSGDPDKLMRAYYSIGANSSIGRQYFATTGEAGISAVRPGQYRGGLIGSIRRFFWGQPTPPGEKRTNYHIPLPADLTSASSALLFAQPPNLKYEEDAGVQDWLNTAVDDGMHAKLLEAAEMCAAFGGVYLRAVWDTDVADAAWIDLVPPVAAVPEFRYDRLTAVTFWSVLEDTGKTVIRHLEKHIPHDNVILHAVYEGKQNQIGRQIDLNAYPETRPIAQVASNGVIELPDQPHDASTVVYIPNLRPNRIWRDLGPMAAPLGRSDFAGLETMFDGLDEAFSSWMRDIRLGKARLIVPSSYLDSIGKGKGAVFEPEREVYSPVNMLVSGESGNGTGIMEQQFNIRWEEHKGTVDSIIETIIVEAGYAGQTMGLSGDIAQTATEVVARERKSLTTRARKINYWRPAVADLLYGLMTVNQIVYGSGVTPVRPDIEFPDVVLPDALELAQTVAALRGAESISIETAVATAHPDWDTDEVGAEVQRIYAEMSLDAMSRARVMISGMPTETLGQQLEEIPGALGTTDVSRQVEDVAGATEDSASGQQIE
jgi:A118 family predicted phage portal protein